MIKRRRCCHKKIEFIDQGPMRIAPAAIPLIAEWLIEKARRNRQEAAERLKTKEVANV